MNRRVKSKAGLRVPLCHIHIFDARNIVSKSNIKPITFLRENNLEQVVCAALFTKEILVTRMLCLERMEFHTMIPY